MNCSNEVKYYKVHFPQNSYILLFPTVFDRTNQTLVGDVLAYDEVHFWDGLGRVYSVKRNLGKGQLFFLRNLLLIHVQGVGGVGLVASDLRNVSCVLACNLTSSLSIVSPSHYSQVIGAVL